MSLGLIWTGPSQIEMIVTVPPLRVALQRALERGLDAGGVEGVLGALAAGELADARDEVLLGRVDDGVGADLQRLALAGVGDLGDDDLARARAPSGTAR